MDRYNNNKNTTVNSEELKKKSSHRWQIELAANNIPAFLAQYATKIKTVGASKDDGYSLFCSGDNGIIASGKARMRSIPSMRSFHEIAWKTVPTLI